MSALAVLLVLVSAFAHASWNLLAKRSTTPEVFTWMMSAAASALVLPAAIVLLIFKPPTTLGWAFIAGTVGLHVVYSFTLGRAYRYGELSIVYPVARGLGLMLIPILGVLVLGESISTVAVLGVVLIFVGIVAVGRSNTGPYGTGISLRTITSDRGLQFAAATGVIIGAYSVLDKRGVEQVTPVLYMFMLTLGGGSGMLAIISRDYTKQQFLTEWKLHWRAAVIGGALQFTAYALVLSAFRFSPVSYVGPFREVAIGIGVVLGALILKERVTRGRAVGAGSVAVGAITIALAP